MRGCERTVASEPSARRAALSRETYQIDGAECDLYRDVTRFVKRQSARAAGELRLIEVKGFGGPTGTVLLTPNERRVAEDRGDCFWLYVVTHCSTKPELQEPMREPARLDWHEVTKVAHYHPVGGRDDEANAGAPRLAALGRQGMKIRKIALKNWKNFAQAEAEIHDRVFLVGPNASGKSNLLDAFRFLRDLASTGGGFQEAIARRAGVSAIRCLAARRYPDVEIAVSLRTEDDAQTWEYDLAFNQDKLRRPLVRREKVRRDHTVLLDRPGDPDRADPQQLTQTHLEQVNVNKDFRDLSTFFASIRYLHIVPQLVREPDRSVGRANDPFGGDFLEQVARTQEKTQKARLRRIQEALRVAVPQLQEVELWRDARGTPHVRGKYQHWRPQGAWQTEEQFSDGTLRLMGLLWVALDKQGPLLLEEPELSLHPEIVRLLPQMLARVQRRTGRQVFLSTHSPELLRDEGIGLDEVLMLRPTAEGTEVSSASSHREIRDLLEGGLSLADAVLPRTKPQDAAQLTLFGEG